ncbi:hypothetical protein RRG08_008944 [Elysia crispata]|uniref:Secreted protein n=1 Tax=Elysia crispata TaxID=231223 RepID=A0AAE1DI18_9GAST|nr:hypothetical protein RRG08_008944 [Elysia crispata]
MASYFLILNGLIFPFSTSVGQYNSPSVGCAHSLSESVATPVGLGLCSLFSVHTWEAFLPSVGCAHSLSESVATPVGLGLCSLFSVHTWEAFLPSVGCAHSLSESVATPVTSRAVFTVQCSHLGGFPPLPGPEQSYRSEPIVCVCVCVWPGSYNNGGVHCCTNIDLVLIERERPRPNCLVRAWYLQLS